jgi:DNA polymerase lambda
MRDGKRKKMTEGTIVASRTEREIFDVLGVPWREPGERRRM